jgi:hypothetical protein
MPSKKIEATKLNAGLKETNLPVKKSFVKTNIDAESADAIVKAIHAPAEAEAGRQKDNSINRITLDLPTRLYKKIRFTIIDTDESIKDFMVRVAAKELGLDVNDL